jgi:hypothetical protein
LGNKTQVGNRPIHGSSLHHIQTTKWTYGSQV